MTISRAQVPYTDADPTQAIFGLGIDEDDVEVNVPEAADIPIADAGNDFTATDVEGALDELQADAEAHAADTSTHGVATVADAADLTTHAADTSTHGVATVADAANVPFTYVVKSADETIQSDATLSNDSELLFAVVANGVYDFEAFIIGDTANAGSNGIDVTFTVPAAAGGVWGDMITQSGGWAELAAAGDLYAFATEVSAAYDMSTNLWILRVQGVVVNGANSGNVNFQWAQNTSHASNTTVKKGSYIKYRRAY